MANKKFSDLTAATTLGDGDIFAIENEAGNSRKITTANVRQSLGSVGALVYKSADETTANYSTATAVPWTAEATTPGYDDAGFHDNVTNNTRLTVPDLTSTYGKKAARVSLHACIAISSATAADWIAARFNKNGAAAVGLPFLAHEGGATTTGLQISAHNIPVTGDGSEYFEVLFQVESDTSITVASSRSAFSIEVTAWQ